jgi:hypothetical protein
MKKIAIFKISTLLILSLLVSTALAAATPVDQPNLQEILAAQNLGAVIDITHMTTEEYLAKTGTTIEGFYSIPGHVTPNIESRADGESQESLLTIPQTVEAYVVCDDDMKLWYETLVGHSVTWDDVYMWAWNILEGGDDPFWPQYEIEYNMGAGHYTNWYSTNYGNLYQIFDEGRTNFPKPSDCDVRVFMTGQLTGNIYGLGEKPGNAFIIRVRETGSWPLANLWQHEASHNYDAPDHDPGLFDWCVMSYTWGPWTRDWCGSCHSTIYTNRYRFG